MILEILAITKTQIPLSQIAFVFIGSLLGLYSARLLSLYQTNRNPLALLHTLLALFGALALLMLGLPFLLTTSPPILIWGDYLAVICITAFFVVLAKIMWFASLQTKVSFNLIALPIILVGFAALISDYLQIGIDASTYPATYINATSSLWLKSILFLIVMVPGSVWYFSQALRAIEKPQKLRLGMISLLMFVMAVTIISENIISQGRGTLLDGIVRLVVGVTTLVVIFVTGNRNYSTKH